MSEIPLKDVETARRDRLFFKVASKRAKGQKWIYVGEGTHSLQDALSQAQGLNAYESAVFVISRESFGSIYWSSLDPDLFNSTVIELASYIYPGDVTDDE